MNIKEGSKNEFSSTLAYIRQVDPTKDISVHRKTTESDQVWLHEWETGSKEHIFSDVLDAMYFAKLNDCEIISIPPRKQD